MSRPSVQDIQLLIPPPPEFLLLLLPELMGVILVPSSTEIRWILSGVGSAMLSRMLVLGLCRLLLMSLRIVRSLSSPEPSS